MDVQFECTRLPSDIRLFTLRRQGWPVSIADYAVGVACAACLLGRVAVKGSIAVTDSTVLLTVGMAVWRVTAAMSSVCEESLLVVQELGVQITRKTYSGKSSHIFIDKDKISSIVINEGITAWRVIFYMAFIVEGQSDMVLAFSLLPRMAVLLPIYRGIRAAVYGEPET